MVGASDGARSIWKDALDDVDAAVSGRLEREDRSADIAAHLHVASRLVQDMRDQRRRRGLAVGAGNRDEGAFGAILARSRQNSSMSPMISTPASRAFADQCGSGWVSGTPGERMKDAKRDQSLFRRSAVSMPFALASAIFAGLSSQAITRPAPSGQAPSPAPSRRGRREQLFCLRRW